MLSTIQWMGWDKSAEDPPCSCFHCHDFGQNFFLKNLTFADLSWKSALQPQTHIQILVLVKHHSTHVWSWVCPSGCALQLATKGPDHGTLVHKERGFLKRTAQQSCEETLPPLHGESRCLPWCWGQWLKLVERLSTPVISTENCFPPELLNVVEPSNALENQLACIVI